VSERRETYVKEHLIAIWTPQTDSAGIDRFDAIVQNDPVLLEALDNLEDIPWGERQARRHEVMKLSNTIERIKNAAERKAFGKIQH
jgi:hypothetical protein